MKSRYALKGLKNEKERYVQTNLTLSSAELEIQSMVDVPIHQEDLAVQRTPLIDPVISMVTEKTASTPTPPTTQAHVQMNPDGSSCWTETCQFTTPCSHFIFLIKDIMIAERPTTQLPSLPTRREKAYVLSSSGSTDFRPPIILHQWLPTYACGLFEQFELRLVPPPAPLIFSAQQHRGDDARQEKPSGEINAVGGDLNEKQNQQQLTIFYNGKVSVCDVTELQARSIIKLASEEIEEKWRRTPGSTTSTELSSPLMISPPVYTPGGLSMKRSLQSDESMYRNQNQNVNENQKLTIFYDGMVSVCDVTELQARAIIKVASGEIDEKWASRTPCSQASSPLIVSPSPSPSTGALSMKRSLQRFLQKRHHRIQATSPYHR
ncbi:protein TIFY 5A [Tanacetum coccineum]